MNDVIKTILDRRSCRKFINKPIPQDDLDEIMKAAVAAPTAMNTQRWIFTVIDDRKIIQNLASAMAKALDRPGYDMYDPQVLIIPSTPAELPYGIDDCACALENIFLAATSLGIDSCWINQMRLCVDDPEIRKILDEFKIPRDYTIYGMAILGYPQEQEFKEIKRVGVVNFIK